MTTDRRGTARRNLERYGEAPCGAQRFRAMAVLACFAVVFVCIGVRLGYVHLKPRSELATEKENQIGREFPRDPRGSILDRKGDLALATDREVPSLYVSPALALDEDRNVDTELLAWDLHNKLGLDLDKMREALVQRRPDGRPMSEVPLKRLIRDEAERDALPALVEAGGGALYTRHEPLRYYPQDDMAAHLLGFVGRDGQAAKGVELLMDEYLTSVPGKVLARRGYHEREKFLMSSRTVEAVAPEGGHDVVLTIDIAIQRSLERALDERMIECKAPRAMGVVLDPHTGAILALANRPAYNPNQYDEVEAEFRRNRASKDFFEPGSTFKIVTAAAALEHQLITPETQIDLLNGRFNPYGHMIKDDHKNPGLHPFTKCFADSSNIAIIKVAAQLGEARLEAWIRRFGFGQTTSRDFAGESSGLFRSRDKWSRLSMGSLPMGQEIGVTMLQLARAYAVIANGGYLVEPHFVAKVVKNSGEVLYQHDGAPGERILSAETAATMRDLCRLVVAEGTGRHARIADYRAAGKTGTAQVARKDGRGYDPNLWTPVFAGFAPAGNPRVVAVIVVPEPDIRMHYGGYVCGPVFSKVVRDALIQLEVPRDPEPEDLPEGSVVADALYAEAASAADGEPGVDLEILDSLELVELEEDGLVERPRLPDFRGMTKHQVSRALRGLGIPWDPTGMGWAVAQEPAAGTALDDVTLCRVVFERKTAREQNDS